jgi:hypothetical protein
MGTGYHERNLMDFFTTFTSEEVCELYFMHVRWPDGMPCLRCGKKNFYPRLKDRRAYQCKACKFFNRPTAGTIFHRTHTSLLEWFVAIFLVAFDKRVLSALLLSEELGLHYRTAWDMLSRMRRAMAKRDAAYKLRGYVEIDEMFIGAPSEASKRGRGTGKTPVLVAVSYVPVKGKEEVTGFAKLQTVETINEKTVADFIKANVESGAVIRTDGLSVYPSMEKYGYTHDREPVRKRTAHLVLPHVHTFISNLRSFVQGTHHGLAETHLQQYLDEFCYRFQQEAPAMFDRLLRACLEQEELPHSALTA